MSDLVREVLTEDIAVVQVVERDSGIPTKQVLVSELAAAVITSGASR